MFLMTSFPKCLCAKKTPQKTKDMQASYCDVALDFFSSIVFTFALIATSVKMSFLLQEEWTCCDFSSSLFTASSMSGKPLQW